MKAQPGFDPRSLDVSAVGEIFTNLVQPCIGKNDSWVNILRENMVLLGMWACILCACVL